MKKLRNFLCIMLSLVMLVAATIPFASPKNESQDLIVNATSATTYTYAFNADQNVVRSQDGYLPQATYDRIGLDGPKDMIIDKVMENGREVEYCYILNSSSSANSEGVFLLKFRMDDVENTLQKIRLTGVVDYISSPTGLWIQTTTVNGITRKEMYIADGSASYAETIPATAEEQRLFNLSDYQYRYNGLIYRIQFNRDTNELLLDSNNIDIIHEPTEMAPRDYSQYELLDLPANDLTALEGRQVMPTASNFRGTGGSQNDRVYRIVCKVGETCDERVVPIGQFVMRTPSFGQQTVFSPSKIAVDTAGNIFVASQGTSAGMIQMSYAKEFVSFFVVNTVEYNFLYQMIKNFGTKEQLEKLDVAEPKAFSNVFIDKDNLVYSITTENTVPLYKYSTGGSSILEYTLSFGGTPPAVMDCYVTNDGLIFYVLKTGVVYVLAPSGQMIFNFGTFESSTEQNIVGFFNNVTSLVVDSQNRIWIVDDGNKYLQTFTPTEYTNNIYNAIISFNNHDYETSRKSWEEVLRYDSLSVLANDGLGKAFYYDLDFKSSLDYFTTSKNRTLYSNVFWELRNDFLQQNLAIIFVIAVAVIGLLILLSYLYKTNKHFAKARQGMAKVKSNRFYKDLTVGFRMIVKPNDTFYELKTHKRGSILGATIYYVLALIAFLLNLYGYALPFQYITLNIVSPSTFMFAFIIVIAVFVLCNYLVSAINDGEGTFADIYKFTGYSLLPMIICLPIATGISYGLTLNEQVIITILKLIAFWGSGILLVIGILETHNYTFRKTIVNIILTLIFMVLFLIICVVIIVMLDQIATFIEQLWREVKLRAGLF